MLPIKFCNALVKVEQAATQVFENPAQLTRPEKQELLKELRYTIACLQGHAKRLERALDADSEEAV